MQTRLSRPLSFFDSRMSTNPYLNAVLASAYIVVVAFAMYFGSQNAGEADSVLAPIAMLSLLVLSVAVMGYLFFFQPVQMFMAGGTAEANGFFLKIFRYFAIIPLLFLAL